MAGFTKHDDGTFLHYSGTIAELSNPFGRAEFCGSDRSELVARLAELPSFLEKSVLSPATPSVES